LLVVEISVLVAGGSGFEDSEASRVASSPALGPQNSLGDTLVVVHRPSFRADIHHMESPGRERAGPWHVPLAVAWGCASGAGEGHDVDVVDLGPAEKGNHVDIEEDNRKEEHHRGLVARLQSSSDQR
jgi:hypothetical protein